MNQLAELEDTIRSGIIFTLSNQPISQPNKQIKKSARQSFIHPATQPANQPGREPATMSARHLTDC